jgi:hypothetical protein
MRWPGHRLAIALACGVLTLWLAAMMVIVHAAQLDSAASGKVLAVFEPGTDEDEVFAKLISAGGRPVRRTWLPFVWVVSGDRPGFVGSLLDEGAVGAYGELPFAPAIAGCLAFADTKIAEIFVVRP